MNVIHCKLHLYEGGGSIKLTVISQTMSFTPGDVHIFDEGGATNIGSTTSGCPSPVLKKNISMGYVKREHAKVGTKVKLEVRNKLVDGVIVKMPFVPTQYYTGK